MKLVRTQNTVYILDTENMTYTRIPLQGKEYKGSDSPNLNQYERRPMVGWSILEDILIIDYPSENCPHGNGPNCMNQHFIETTKVQEVTEIEDD